MKVLNDYFNIDKFDNISLCGMNSESFDIFLNNLSTKSKKNILVVTSSLYEANKIYAGLSNYTDILIIDWCNCLCIRVVG